MVRFTSFALSFWAAQAAAVSTQTSVRSVIQTRSRELSAEKIAGYEPQSQVTDHVSDGFLVRQFIILACFR